MRYFLTKASLGFDKWLGGWQKNGWLTAEKKAVKNAELIRYIAALLEARVRIGQKVFLEYVRGHVGIQGNEGADRLANMGCTMSEVEERDWESLRQDYMAKVEELIAARKLQLAQKDQRGIIEVVGAKEASEDLQKEIETEEGKKLQTRFDASGKWQVLVSKTLLSFETKLLGHILRASRNLVMRYSFVLPRNES